MIESTLSPATLWRKHPRETVALGSLAVAGMIAAAGVAWSSPSLGDISRSKVETTAPAPPPLLVRNIAATDAVAVNRDIPLSSSPNPSAQPFSMAKLDSATRARALECLTSTVYYEAGQESTDGQRSVAQVVLNRVRHPAFPSSVCGVVYQGSTRSTGCQFTFTCDGSLQRQPNAVSWTRARRVAEAALTGAVHAPVGLATHYHADYVVPYWASSLAKNAVVGAHLFYRWAGGWGRPPAFDQAYAGQEPSAQALRATALAALAARPAKSQEQQIAAIPGAEMIDKAPPGRVAVRFKLDEARKAVEEAPRIAYVEKVQASDNLRWTLSGGAPAADQKPLGRTSAEATPAPGASN
ncbi:MAG: cell wall hydrolase [Pseudomonadota bacterium]|nr:cell wall hydrolase [Pseudomonadota bacterium]